MKIKKTHIQKNMLGFAFRFSVFDLACEKLSCVFLAWMLIVRGLGDIHIHVDNILERYMYWYSSTLHHFLLT